MAVWTSVEVKLLWLGRVSLRPDLLLAWRQGGLGKQVCSGEWGGLGQLKQPAIAVAGLGRFALLELL